MSNEYKRILSKEDAALEKAILAKLAEQKPETAGNYSTCAIADANYAAGMLQGWNLCVADDEEKFSLIRENRMRAAAQASRASKDQDAAQQPTSCQGILNSSSRAHDATFTNKGTTPPYSIDKDELGIREVVSAAIFGAMAAGKEGSTPPPEGHWLNEFYQVGMSLTKNHILDDGQAIPNGWLLMPEKHTLDMMEAFAETWYSKKRCVDDHDMQDAYAALTTAAPKYEGENP